MLREAADAVLRANGLLEARVRITITGGVAPLGSERGEAPPDRHRRRQRGHGRGRLPAKSSSCRGPRNERGATAGLKTISYAENVRALAFAQERGASEAIFANTRDELCEATGSNVFVVRDGIVSTPPASSGCLLGVTRALVLELCAEHGIRADERPLPIGALRVGRRGVPHLDGARGAADRGRRRRDRCPSVPGPVTAALAEAFRDLVARDLDP